MGVTAYYSYIHVRTKSTYIIILFTLPPRALLIVLITWLSTQRVKKLSSWLLVVRFVSLCSETYPTVYIYTIIFNIPSFLFSRSCTRISEARVRGGSELVSLVVVLVIHSACLWVSIYSLQLWQWRDWNMITSQFIYWRMGDNRYKFQTPFGGVSYYRLATSSLTNFMMM